MKNLIVGSDVLLTYHTYYYDGIISGICYYNNRVHYFDMFDEKVLRYELGEEDVEEIKSLVGKDYSEDCKFSYLSYRIYRVYPFKSVVDEYKALASKAVWEDFVGFQNSHDGTFSPRFSGNRFEGVNRNDFCMVEKGLYGINEMLDSRPYASELNFEVDKNNPLGEFYIGYEEVEQLIKEGYKLEEIDNG